MNALAKSSLFFYNHIIDKTKSPSMITIMRAQTKCLGMKTIPHIEIEEMNLLMMMMKVIIIKTSTSKMVPSRLQI